MDRDRLMICVTEGRTDLYCLRNEVGIGSRSQVVSGEPDKSAENSSIVARWKASSRVSSGGLKAGGRCGEELVVPDRIEDQSL